MLSRLAILALTLATASLAQPASDLLQSAIFDQDTAGDLDSAIRIYRQILAAGPEMRLYAAQAQYRLGVCLLRKGDTAAADKAFQSLIHDYPDDRDLIARARENMSQRGSLLPAPWTSTEVAEYRWTNTAQPVGQNGVLLEAGSRPPILIVEDIWSLTRIAPAGKSGAGLRIQMSFYSPQPYNTMMDVDGATMRATHVTYRSPSQAARPGAAESLGAAGSLADRARRSGIPGTYEYGELLYLLRRMPVYPGWAATIPVAAPDGSRVDLNASVAGIETVTVPAGTFQCFKLLLATDPKITPPKYTAAGTDLQTFGADQFLWYAMTGARPLVKMQVGPFTGELTSLRSGEPKGSTSYRDPFVDFSFTVPSGWIFHSRAGFNGPATSVELLDPDLQVFATISFKSKKTDPAKIQDELLLGVVEEQRLRPNLTTRGAIEHGEIGGHPTVSWIGERSGVEGKIVRWTTWIQSESTRGSIAVAVPADEFDRFRARFQSILDSFRMP